MPMSHRLLGLLWRWSIPANLFLASALFGGNAFAELQVPAFTAYLDPDPEGATVNARAGIANWSGPSLKVLWFGDLQTTGRMDCSLSLRLPTNTASRLRLTVAGQSHEATIKGAGTEAVIAGFGSFNIETPVVLRA